MLAAAYQTLGVAEDAEPEVVDAAYRALMKKYHPDRWSGPAEEGRARSQAINAAYETIKAGSRQPISSVVEEGVPSAGAMPDVELSLPVHSGRNLGWFVAVSVAILAACAAISTR